MATGPGASIWPLTAEPALSVGGIGLAAIAEKFGTPAYVVDEEHVRARCRAYGNAPGLDEVAYSARAFWCRAIACAAYDIPVPRLTVEPGRAIAGQAGLTLYRVLTVKRGPRTLVVVDGGISDSPRPAPHGGRRHVERVGALSTAPAEPMTVVGRHCDAGDVLVPEALLPGDIRPGDLLAVPCTGAYHHAMASNYNLVTRPPVIAVRGGRARPVIRRETDEDVLRRDVG